MKRTPIKRKTPLRAKRPEPRNRSRVVLTFKRPSENGLKRKYLGDDGVIRYPSGREVCDQTTSAGRDEYERRKFVMWRRQGHRCVLLLDEQCKKQNGVWALSWVTFDHENGRGMGGGKRDDRVEIDGKPINAAVCWNCNNLRGSRHVPYHGRNFP